MWVRFGRFLSVERRRDPSVRGAARLRVGTLMTIIPVHACHTQYFHAVGLWTLALLRFGL